MKAAPSITYSAERPLTEDDLDALRTILLRGLSETDAPPDEVADRLLRECGAQPAPEAAPSSVRPVSRGSR